MEPGTGSRQHGIVSTASPAHPASAEAVRVLTVDDQEVFHAAARELITATPGFTWIGAAYSGEHAIELVGQLAPDLVLMDVRMPGIGGLEATRRIGATAPEIVTVLVSAETLPDEQLPPHASAVVRKSALRRSLLRSLWEHHRRS